MKPHPKQLAFIRCQARFPLAMCGAQSGKSLAAAPKFVDRVLRDMKEGLGGGRYWVVDPTFELAQQAQEYFLDRLRRKGVRYVCKSWSGSAGIYKRIVIRAYHRRARVDWKSADRPERLVAVPVDGMWINESATIKDQTWTGKLQSRFIATGGWAILDTTPMGENWVFTEFYLRGLPKGHGDYRHDAVVDTAPQCTRSREYCTHTWYSADNPAVPRERVEQARKTLPAWAFRREWEGDPHHFAGQLFPHWDDDRNVRTVNLAEWPEVELSVDWGFGVGHPFALLMIGIDKARRRMAIAREHVEEGMQFEDQVALIAAWAAEDKKIRRITGDSADPGMLAMARARRIGRHVDVVPSSKGPGSVYDGTVAQADMIGLGDYIVDPKCTATIRQHKGARWRPKRMNDPTGETTEEPLRRDDDTVAAARYCLWPRLGRAPRSGSRADTR